MFEEIVTELTKGEFKKKKKAKAIRQRKHIRLSPKQKQALKKARRKSNTAGAKRARQKTKQKGEK